MRIFELRFNPRRAGIPEKSEALDVVFDSFCYEPGNIYERRLGSLAVAGELKNVLPQNLKFLENLALEVKKQYYSSSVKSSPESSLKKCLRKTNEFLEEVAKKGDVSWLGNLNLAVLASFPQKKNIIEVNFAKVGQIKLLLMRQGRIMDIGKNLELSEIEPYPLKIFSNIVSGKLAENDVVVVLSEEIFNVLHQQGLLEAMARITMDGSPQSFEVGLRKILRGKEKELSELSGICLLCLLVKESFAQGTLRTSLTYQKEPEKFSIKGAFQPLIQKIKIPTLTFPKISPLKFKEFFKKPLKIKTEPKEKIGKKDKKLKLQKWWSQRKELIKLASNSKKNLIFVALLIVLLILGFLLF